LSSIVLLKQEFLDRRHRRPAYSERAFARDLDVSPGYVSLLFRGLRTLSPGKAMEISQRLGWSEEKTREFVAGVQEHNLKATLRGGSRASKSVTRKDFRFEEVAMDKFRFVVDLHHIATLTLIQSRSGVDIQKVSRTFGLSQLEAESIVERLIKLELVRRLRGKLVPTRKSLEVQEVPSVAIRAFHRQAILKAEDSIEGQPVMSRNLASLTLSLDSERMEEARAFIYRFLRSFEKKFGNADNGKIYMMNTQLFELSRNDALEKEPR